MLPIRVLQFIMGAPEFIAHITKNGINPHICLEMKMRRVLTEEYLFYDVHFDYGLPDLDSKDITVRVLMIDNDTFRISQIRTY